ncbi:hypothetical protein P171DRAFT_492994 [Karstenula rhodostoma CBS 690.94]|uniref:Uncharacterized protein n=1 Tax=Karstenula rhodostoma CBS 690.94 TaxID=1392251 RepID=A0A9P4PUF7_9PLEO|nr:hypothetical protein P171DRAFT_492994 [Karstenula rhodostoma CBS 690.94]
MAYNANNLLAAVSNDLATAMARIAQLQSQSTPQDIFQQGDINDLRRVVVGLEEQIRVAVQHAKEAEIAARTCQLQLEASHHNSILKTFNAKMDNFQRLHPLLHYKTGQPIPNFPPSKSQINKLEAPELQRLLLCLGMNANVESLLEARVRLIGAVGS